MAKGALEAACDSVSCADVLAFAARDASAVLSGGGVNFMVPAAAATAAFPPPAALSSSCPPLSFNLSELAAKGLDTDDLVVLSGAHTAGCSHCSPFVSDGRADHVPASSHPSRCCSGSGPLQMRRRTVAVVDVLVVAADNIFFIFFPKMFAECQRGTRQRICRVPENQYTANSRFAGRCMPCGVCHV